MLTPSFTLDQCNKFLTIIIRVPFAKVDDYEIVIESYVLTFHSSPYFLRLTFSGELVESDDHEATAYNIETGSFTVRVPKLHPGQHFTGLEFLTQLLAPRGTTHCRQPLIEVLGGEDFQDENALEDGEVEGYELEEEEEEVDCYFDQEPSVKEEPLSLSAPKYGFRNLRSGVFKKLQSELCESIDLHDADDVSEHQRTVLRQTAENEDFNLEYYRADFYESDVIQPILDFVCPWNEQTPFSSEQNEIMLTLPRKHYILDKHEESSAFLGLVDIIFSYAYDYRTTEGDHTVESDWTVCKLSATFSWLESWKRSNIRDVVRSSFRRTLCYPLYRNWQLSQMVFKDVQDIFTSGKSIILKCLMDIKSLFCKSDDKQIFNDLYITDYCVWIQTVSEKRVEALAQQLQEITLMKSDLTLDIEDLEKVGSLVESSSESTEQSDTDESDDSSDSDSESSDDDESSTVNSESTDGVQSTSNSSSICPVSDLEKALMDLGLHAAVIN